MLVFRGSCIGRIFHYPRIFFDFDINVVISASDCKQ
jgi:hypothetical protein